jgi:RND superfamily putative drug exporter
VIGYTPAGFGSGPAAPAGSDSAAGNALLVAHFPAADRNPTGVLLHFPTSVSIDPAPAAQAQRLLATSPDFNSVVGPFDSNQSLLAGNQFVSPDGRTVQFNVSLAVGDPASNAATRQVPVIRAAVAAIARQVGADANGVTGQAPSTYDVGQASDGDLLRIFPVAILAIAILLALVLRSLIAPLYLIASVALSYLAAFGLSVLLFQDANGNGGLPYFVPFLMFLFLLALGEDYNILVMARIREEAGDIPLRQAVPRALERTGSTISSAGLVLAGTFGVFAFVENSQPGGGVYRDILASLAIGILMDAFLVRTLLVPATVALLGRWNWWPSSHGRPVEPDPEPSLAAARQPFDKALSD